MTKTSPVFFDSIAVIVGRDLVGDALMKLPFLRALRNAYPRAEITWITSQGPTAFGGQLREFTRSLIDKVYEQPDWLPTLVKPETSGQAPRFDLILDTRNRWREALLVRKLAHQLFLSPAMHYMLSGRRPNLLKQKPLHLVDQLLDLVELACGYRPPATGALPVDEAISRKAREILPEGPLYVGLAPGAGNREKTLPRYKFEKVALSQAKKGRVPVFILGPQELSWYDELLSAVPSAKFPLQDYDVWGGQTISLDHTLAIGKLLDVAVVNDSGVGHMLAAADCPLISLFGPTSPEKLAPRVSKSMVIRAQDYGMSHMRAIPSEVVNAAVDTMLADRSS
jgi:ADP-heptose:LPS heptosyltransferase